MALGKRKVVGSTTKAKKETHKIIKVDGEDFAEKLKKFNELKNEIKNRTAEQKSIEGEIKEISLEEYIKLYEQLKRNPESIKIESVNGDRVMFVVTKKYSGAVDEERAEELREKYGDAIVEESSELVMDNNLLNKYSDELEELIMSADFMTDEEKENLFVEKVKFAIKSEAINEAFTSGSGDVEELITDLNPVIMLKQTK
jgi:delta 1-pyrroline-5-carboxylate dehydrogenase